MRALGHSSPEITAAIYDHSDIEDFREVAERALTFGSAQVNAPVMQGPKYLEGEGPGASEEPSDSRAFRWSGRLDLNQRPLAPQVRPHHQSTLVESGNSSQGEWIPDSARSMLSLEFVAFRSKVNAPVMQEIGTTSACPRLLTVKEAAARLRVSPATVYGACERGELRHVRITTHAIRIAEPDLSAFLHRRRSAEV